MLELIDKKQIYSQFYAENLCLSESMQGYQYHKLRKAFSRFYQRHPESIVKYNVCLKALLQDNRTYQSQYFGSLFCVVVNIGFFSSLTITLLRKRAFVL